MLAGPSGLTYCSYFTWGGSKVVGSSQTKHPPWNLVLSSTGRSLLYGEVFWYISEAILYQHENVIWFEMIYFYFRKNKTANIVVLYVSFKNQWNLKIQKLNPKICGFTVYKYNLLKNPYKKVKYKEVLNHTFPQEPYILTLEDNYRSPSLWLFLRNLLDTEEP